MRRIDILLVLLMMLILVPGCKKQKEYEGILLEIDWRPSVASEGVDLLTYGTNNIQKETLTPDKKGHILVSRRLDRDTIDLLILNALDGSLLVPLFPHQLSDIKVRHDGDSLYLEGVKYQEQIQQYRTLLSTCVTDVSEEMLTFLREQSREPVTLLLTQDIIHRFPETTCADQLRSIEQTTIRIAKDYANVIGIEQSLMGLPPRYDFPHYVAVSGEEESIELKKKMGKKPLMAVSLLAIEQADSAELARIKAYYGVLDSLGLPSFHVLPLVDSLPSGWSVKKGNNWRSFLLDSTGMASSFMAAYDFPAPPLYMLVDSTMQIWRSWEETDSLVNFIKAYNEGKKVPKKKRK